MGCSFCKREIKLKMQNINSGSLKSKFKVQDLQVEHSQADQISSIKICDGEDQQIILHTNYNGSKEDDAIQSEEPDDKQLDKFHNNEIGSKNHFHQDQVKFIMNANHQNPNKTKPVYSKFIGTPEQSSKNVISNIPIQKPSTYRVIDSCSKAVYLKVYIAGFNSKFTKEHICKKFVESGMMIPIIAKGISTNSINNIGKFSSDCFHVSEQGMEILNILKNKAYIPEKSNINISKTISNIIDNLIPFTEIMKSKLKSEAPRKRVFIDTHVYYINFVSIDEMVESLDLKTILSQNDEKFRENILFLSFDYFKRSSFDYIVNLLENSKLKGVKLLAIGIKGINIESSCRNSDSISEKTYEVNEDFARLSFQSLEVEIYTIRVNDCVSNENNQSLIQQELDSLMPGESINHEKAFSVEEKIFLSMFILNNLE